MFSGVDSFMGIFQVVWGFWPLILFGALTGTIEHSKKKNLVSNIVYKILLVWGIFAIIWVLLTVTGFPPPGYFIKQPLNSTLFWLIGIVLIGIQTIRLLSSRNKIRSEMLFTKSRNDLLKVITI